MSNQDGNRSSGHGADLEGSSKSTVLYDRKSGEISPDTEASHSKDKSDKGEAAAQRKDQKSETKEQRKSAQEQTGVCGEDSAGGDGIKKTKVKKKKKKTKKKLQIEDLNLTEEDKQKFQESLDRMQSGQPQEIEQIDPDFDPEAVLKELVENIGDKEKDPFANLIAEKHPKANSQRASSAPDSSVFQPGGAIGVTDDLQPNEDTAGDSDAAEAKKEERRERRRIRKMTRAMVDPTIDTSSEEDDDDSDSDPDGWDIVENFSSDFTG